jgi:hypothetical protein
MRNNKGSNIIRHVEQLRPLLLIKRYWESPETVDRLT